MNPIRTLGLLVMLLVACVLPGLAQNAFAPPVVVFYPLSFSGGGPANEAGSDVAIILATKVSDGGGVVVRPYLPGTQRVDYLKNAIAAKADYYVSGYLQAIGTDVSMILQVVSTYSGSVVYSTTTTIHTYGDAAAQADAIREAIVRHAGRGFASLDAPAAQPAPSVAPTRGAGGVNLSNVLHRHAKETPTPSATSTADAGLVPVSQFERPSPSASASAPAPAIARVTPQTTLPTSTSASAVTSGLVVDTAGGEADDLRTLTASDLMTALRNKHILVARIPISIVDARKNAANICRANPGMTSFYAPLLVLGLDEDQRAIARVSVDIVDCTGATVATRADSEMIPSHGGIPVAIDRADAKLAIVLGGT